MADMIQRDGVAVEEVSECEQHLLHDAKTSAFSKLLRAASLTTVGVAIGGGGYLLSEQGRFRTPVVPLSQGALEDITKLPEELPRFPVPFPVPPGDMCGAAKCSEGDLCCPGGPGYGYSCGTTNAVCCQGFLFFENGGRAQVSVAIVCGEADVCCVNGGGNPYCCASGNHCHKDVCIAGDNQCFPGHAFANVVGQGNTRLADLRVGDNVLVASPAGNLLYEPVLGFHHELPDATSDYTTLVHEDGEFRASASHLVFVFGHGGFQATKAVSEVSNGDELLLTDPATGSTLRKAVLMVRQSTSTTGMFAPITASGTLVVDDAVASTYALTQAIRQVEHGAMHSAMFASRLCSMVGMMMTRLKISDRFTAGHLLAQLQS